jgi:hypothetical protein
MGRKGPRAGMPVANIQSVLDDLTEAGFSIVVCEQADDIHKKGRKVRFISEVITPSSPTYTYGLAMSHKANICFPEAPPEFGIAANTKGIKVVEINPDLRTSLVLEGLTEEAAIIRLNKYGGRLNRIFLHDKTPKSLLDAANLKFHNLVKVSGYDSRAFPKRVEELIKIDLGMDAEMPFTKADISRCSDSVSAPAPLYQHTAEQIGILPKRGIPDLINLMLPKGSPATCKYIVRNLLLNPPPKKYANSLRQAIIELQTNQKQLPMLIVSNPVRYIKTLNKNEAHPEILKDLFCLAEIFLKCQKSLSRYPNSPHRHPDENRNPFSKQTLRVKVDPNFRRDDAEAQDYELGFIKNTLEIVSYISAIKADQKILHDTSKKIIALLAEILPKQEDLAYVPKNELIPATLFERIEEQFRGRIAPTSSKEISNLYQKSEIAAKKYEAALQKIIAIIAKEKTSKSRKLGLSYDIHNQAIWLLGSLNHEIIS